MSDSFKASRLSGRQLLYLILLALVAIAIRVPFVSKVGFDDQFFQAWGDKIIQYGLIHVYEAPNIPNYPPLYLYILTPLAYFSQNVLHASPASAPVYITLQKSLNCLIDLINGGLIFYLLRRRLPFTKAFLGSALYLLNPYILYDSAVWGQVDNLISCAALSALCFVDADNLWGTYASLAAGLLIKVQTVIFLPIFLLYLLLRYGWRRQVLPVLAAIAGALVVLTPFILNGSIHSLFQEAYVSSAGYFPYLSLNAHNLWWLISDPHNIFTDRDDVTWIFGITPKLVGLFLFAGSYLLCLVYFWRSRRNLSTVCIACGLAYLAFYCLNTEMHERYMYPFFVFWLVGTFLANRPNLLWMYGILSLTQLLSLILMIAPYSWMWNLRLDYFPAITYPLAYTNLSCLVAAFVWAHWESKTYQRRLPSP